MSVDSDPKSVMPVGVETTDCLYSAIPLNGFYSDPGMLALGWAAELGGNKQTASEPHGAGLSLRGH